jgi:SnoaL-like domain
VDEGRIIATINRYAMAIDTKDWTLFRSLFADDCVMEVGSSVHRGADSLTEHMRGLHEPLDASMHRMTNTTMEPSDDGVRARTYLDALLVRRDHPAGPTLRIVGLYDDVLRPNSDTWVIQHRRFRAVWREGNSAVLQP